MKQIRQKNMFKRTIRTQLSSIQCTYQNRHLHESKVATSRKRTLEIDSVLFNNVLLLIFAIQYRKNMQENKYLRM